MPLLWMDADVVAVVAIVASAASALEVVPYTLAENAGMNPISIVTELRSEHAKGKVGAGGWILACCVLCLSFSCYAPPATKLLPFL